jgi:hypothetical protein
MITPEEREEIIAAAVERTLLSIPQVVGNLMLNQSIMLKNSKKFYEDNPDFVDHKDIVSSVIEITEGSNPYINRKDLLDKAVPEIKKRISMIDKLDTKYVISKPDLGDL